MVAEKPAISLHHSDCAALFYACEHYLHASRTGVTIDEQVHILAGYRYWECGDFAIDPEHPPLLKLIAAWPLHSRQLWTPPPACGSAVTSKLPPQTVIGGAVLVYNGEFDVPLAAAMSHVNRAEFYEIAGDPLRAVEESEIAVSLGSDDVRTHHSLAEAFATANKKPEAKRQLVATLALSAVNRRSFFRDCYRICF